MTVEAAGLREAALMQNNKSTLPGLTVRQPDCGSGLVGQVKSNWCG